jgi:pimeloyl-ACP methyl ester carboxylesterase
VPSFVNEGVRLSYEVRGTGNPAVLLHGFTSLGRTWERRGLVQMLVDQGLRAISPESRSHGASDAVFDPVKCTTDLLANDVIALLDHLTIDSAALVGFSMGGGVAIRAALDVPERVTRLVVGGVGDSAMNAVHDPMELRDLADVFSGQARPREGSNAFRLLRNAEGAGNDPQALLPFLRQGGWPGGLTNVSPLTVPALVILADGDEYMAGAEKLLAALRPSEVMRVHARGHHDVLDDDAVKQNLVRFLTSPD